MVRTAIREQTWNAGQETAILKRCLAGDWSEYALVVERYQRLVWAAVDAVVAEPCDVPDLVQETFIKAFEKLHTFGFRSSFSSWLYRVARNLALNHLRKHARRPKASSLELDDNAGRNADESLGAGGRPEANLWQAEQERELERLIRQLPEHYREVINLYYLQELSYEEIAEHVGRPLNTIRTHLRRAREQLKEMGTAAGWR